MSKHNKSILWAVYCIYLLASGFAMFHHELWGDEIHSWNIAKGSAGITDLISNTRYEGHPPVWYIILWSVSKFTHALNVVQLVQLVIADAVVFMLLFISPLPFTTKLLIPFGYYFLYEYAVLTRNYAIGILLAFNICNIIRKNFKYKLLLYYGLLFLLSNTHFLGAILAGSLHLYFLLWNLEQKKRKTTLIFHGLLGLLLFLPCLYFISPPRDSLLGAGFWVGRWSIKQFALIVQAPLRAFVAIPAWWDYNFWNTQFLLEAQSRYTLLKFIDPLISLTLIGLVFYVLKENKKCVAMFATNLFLTGIMGVMFPLSTARYSGFIFIAFIAAYWLFCYETPSGGRNKRIVDLLLVVQLIGAVIAVTEDFRFPFSNLPRAAELLKEVNGNERIVTDYWTIDAMSAFIDKPFYCIDFQKSESLLFWDEDMRKVDSARTPYTNGVTALFRKGGISRVYLISANSPQKLALQDPQLSKSFRVELIDKRDGAIEKSSDLYLYRISTH